jgi:hypothetical protein
MQVTFKTHWILGCFLYCVHTGMALKTEIGQRKKKNSAAHMHIPIRLRNRTKTLGSVSLLLLTPKNQKNLQPIDCCRRSISWEGSIE